MPPPVDRPRRKRTPLGMRQTFDKGLLLALGLVVATLLVNALLAYRNTVQLNEDAGWVGHTHEVLDACADVLRLTVDAETGERGFLITGKAEFLEPYTAALAPLDQHLAKLKHLTSDNPRQQQRVAELERLVGARLAWLAKGIELRRKNATEAQAYTATGEGKRQMDALRALVASMEREEHELLQAREQQTASAYRVAVTTGLLSALLGLGLVGAFVALMARHLLARQRAAELLYEQREWFRTTLSSIGDAVIATDTNGRVAFLNSVARDLTGWSEDEARGVPLDKVFPIVNERSRQPVENPVQRALAEGRVVGLANHTVLMARDGTERPIDDSAAPIRNAAGAIAGVVLIFRDVSERRRVEDAAHRGMARYKALVEAASQMVWVTDPQGLVVEDSPSWRAFTGQTAEQWLGRGWLEALHPDDRAPAAEVWSRSVATGTVYETEYRIRARDGSYRLTLARGVPVRDNQGQIVEWVGMNVDITEQRQADEDRQRFVLLVENCNDFIGICDLQFVPVYVNRAGRHMIGLEEGGPAQHVGVRDFFFPEDHSLIFDEFLPRVLRDGHGEVEVRFRHFQTGQPLWMVYSVLTLRDAAGKPTGLATISRNITDRKCMEEALKDADRRKDEFLATLAHELRNPLAPLRNALHILRLTHDNPATLGQVREMMERQLGQMVRLVDDLLDVSRITRGKIELRKEPVDVRRVVQSALETSRPLIDSAGHELTVSLPDESLCVEGDLTRLAQVLANLLNNAAKYTPERGRISLTVERHEEQVVLRVRDNGIGIPADMLPHIFDMFTQVDRALDRAQGGLGIGLTLVRRLVEMHGGLVEAHSDGPERGSEFVVRLPLIVTAPDPPVPSSDGRHQAPSAPGRRILIADDNTDGAASLALYLQMLGHEVRTACDGPSAVQTAAEFRPDVALLDIGMPGMDGYETGTRLRQLPGLAAVVLIALTGWGQEEDRRRTEVAGFHAHLVKPLDPAELHELLAGLPAS